MAKSALGKGLSALISTRPSGIRLEAEPDEKIQAFKLENGDTLFIPTIKTKFSVLGAVGHPGTFPLPANRPVTVLDAFNLAATNAHFRVLDLGSGSEREFLWFNQNTGKDVLGKLLVNPVKLKWFRNKKFRQAISCAIDRERIAKEAYLGRAKPIFNFISAENQKWNNPVLKERCRSSPRSSEEFRALLDLSSRDYNRHL